MIKNPSEKTKLESIYVLNLDRVVSLGEVLGKLYQLSLSYYLKRILTMGESICLARHQEKSFNFLKPILDNL